VDEELSELGEFGLLRRLLPRISSDDLIVPPGDDAAVVATQTTVVATTDLLVEGRHFDLGFSSPADVGFKSISVNVSDIAAMGARPRYALVSLGAPPSTATRTIEALYDGIIEAAREFEVAIAGGDSVGSDVVILSVAVLGEPGTNGVVERAGARAGDVLCVTGELGAAAAGLALLRAASSDPSARDLLNRYPELATAHRRGRARVREGEQAASVARAMIDVSDGLIADVGHLCERSQVGALLDAHTLPVAPGVYEVEEWSGSPGYALSGGDDYELAIAVASDDVDALTAALAPTALTVVGRFVEGRDVSVAGAAMPATGGWDSFS
jgi:thiamine-monophosphate kinase